MEHQMNFVSLQAAVVWDQFQGALQRAAEKCVQKDGNIVSCPSCNALFDVPNFIAKGDQRTVQCPHRRCQKYMCMDCNAKLTEAESKIHVCQGKIMKKFEDALTYGQFAH